MPARRIARPPALAKLSPPRLGRAFGRERLFAAIDSQAAAPGLWIAGPPGAGKTTLVSTYLEARAAPCVWLQLDAADAEPATLAHYLREAAAPLAGRRALRLPTPTADDLRDVPAFLRRTLRHLAHKLPAPWALVLDNVQDLGDASLLHAGFAAALAELPAGVRLIAISREPPPPAYARAVAGQQLVCIDAPALRFTADEVGRLLDLHGGNWSAEAMHRASDGWAAAMILMLAAQTDPGSLRGQAETIARQTLFDLFAGEVLDRMDLAQAAALERIAFLPSATGSMAADISGDPQAGELLAELARRSLFTDRRQAPEPSYTFHALFGEFLRARAAARLAPEALHALRLDAAALLLRARQPDAAVRLLIEARAWDAVLEQVAALGGRLAAQGRTAVLKDWLTALPPERRLEPAPSYWLGYAELALDANAALGHLDRAQHGFEAAGDDRGAFLTACAAADAVIFLGASFASLAPRLPLLARVAPVYLDERDPETDLRVLPGLLAAFVHRDPGHPLTARLADAAEQLLDQPLGASQRILLGTLAYFLLWTGQTPRLDRMLVKVERLCAGQDAAAVTLLRWYGVGVLVRSLLGRIPEALADAARALALTTGAPAPMRAKAHLMMVLAALAARDAEQARQHLAEAAGVLSAGNPIDVTTYDFQRGMLMLLDADWHGAAQLMRASVPSGQASGWPLREHIALLGQALAAAQVGALDEAETALQAALHHRFHAVCRWHHWIAGLIEAHLAERCGDRTRALRALAQAFATARECGYDFGPMPFCCGDMMPRLAWLAIEHDIDPALAQRIVRRYALPAPATAGERWPWPVRIRTLGPFSIELDGAVAPAARKESRKPLELLKLLIALGGSGVPVSRLSASLWPDAPGDAARNSFDNTLHRLRKLLGGDDRVPLQHGALGLDRHRCWTDVAALDTCLAQAEALGPAPDAPRLRGLVDDILALYRGEFVAGEDGSPELLSARARLQARFVRQVGALGAALESSGERAAAVRLYQRVIEQQPLAEDIYRRLIGCLIALGQRAEAYEAYRRCRQQLSVLLGLQPAPETEALVSGLRNL